MKYYTPPEGRSYLTLSCVILLHIARIRAQPPENKAQLKLAKTETALSRLHKFRDGKGAAVNSKPGAAKAPCNVPDSVDCPNSDPSEVPNNVFFTMAPFASIKIRDYSSTPPKGTPPLGFKELMRTI